MPATTTMTDGQNYSTTNEYPDVTLRFHHLESMLTDIGIWQHAKGAEPDTQFGYSIDDEARALIVALGYWRRGIHQDFFQRMGTTCWKFIEDAAVGEGRFHNFCDENEKWLDSFGSADSFGRTFWAIGVASAANVPWLPSNRIKALLDSAMPYCGTLNPLRAIAFSMLGLSASRADDVLFDRLANRLSAAYNFTAGTNWHWFEDSMTYCNARLSHVMFLAGSALENERYIEMGTESLDFLLSVMQNGKGSYAPVGNAPMSNGQWFKRGDPAPPLFDQQPVDAGALVECCVAAYQATSEPRFRKAAYDAYGWYFGANVHGLSVYERDSGGVADALTRTGINANMGAESVLSINLARLALDSVE